MGKITGRFFSLSDIGGIVRLYNLITGRARTDEQHAWEWIHNPLCESDIWILEDEENHEIVGHHGLIPLTLAAGDEKYYAGKTENSILHPKYAGTGIYFIHEQRFFNKVKNKYDLLFTTSGHGLPGKIRKRLGYISLAAYSKYFLLANPCGFKKLADYYTGKRKIENLKKMLISATLIFSFWLIYLFTRKVHPKTYGISFCEHSTFSPDLAKDLDLFWNQNKQFFGTTIDRNSIYLKWRIFDNPNIDHTFICMHSSDGQLCGYSILAMDKKNFPRGVIIDLVTKGKDENLLKDLIQASKEFFQKHEISYIEFSTLNTGSVLNRIFNEMGFSDLSKVPIVNKKKSSFMVYFNPRLKENGCKNPEHWYYTHLFTEGFVI